MKKVQILIIALSLILIGCTNGNVKNDIIKTIQSKCQGNTDCVIKIQSITKFKWDKVVMFNQGASQDEVNNVLGFEFNRDVDMNIIIIFLLKGKIVHQEIEQYDPEKPSKLYVKYPNERVHHLVFSPKNSVFKAEILKVDEKNFFQLTPMRPSEKYEIQLVIYRRSIRAVFW